MSKVQRVKWCSSMLACFPLFAVSANQSCWSCPLPMPPPPAAGGLSLPMRTFLTALAPVAARQPCVFVAACRATVEIKGGSTGRLWIGCGGWAAGVVASLHLLLLARAPWFSTEQGVLVVSFSHGSFRHCVIPLLGNRLPLADMGGLAGRRTTVVLKKKQQQQQEAAAAPAAPAAAGAAGPSGGSPPQAQERDTATPAPVAGSAPGAAVAADAAAATTAPAAAARATPAPATGVARRSGAARPAAEVGEQPGSPPAVQGAVTPAPPKTGGNGMVRCFQRVCWLLPPLRSFAAWVSVVAFILPSRPACTFEASACSLTAACSTSVLALA